MTRKVRWLVAALAVLLAWPLFPVGGVTAARAPRRSPCCFANPTFAGACEVRPAHAETCASILAYLNRPDSVGKTYCDSTSIRGGWTPVRCKSR